MNKKSLTLKIGMYDYKLNFFKYTDGKYDGVTKYNDRLIEVRDDLDDIATLLIIRHEIIHALLCTQGRGYQRKFDLEEVCEFIAYKLPEINEIMEQIEMELTDQPLVKPGFGKYDFNRELGKKKDE